MSPIRTKIIAAAVATAATLSLAACGDETEPQPEATASVSVPETHGAPSTTTNAAGKSSAFMKADFGHEPNSRLDAAGLKADQRLDDPASMPGQILTANAQAFDLDPDLWTRPKTGPGYGLRIDSLPWKAPEYTSSTQIVFPPVTPDEITELDAKVQKDLNAGSYTPLWHRMEEAGAAPDLSAIRAQAATIPDTAQEPLGAKIANDGWRMSTCTAYTHMSSADEKRVRDVFGQWVVDLPASEWRDGGIAVVLPSRWDLDLLPCQPNE